MQTPKDRIALVAGPTRVSGSKSPASLARKAIAFSSAHAIDHGELSATRKRSRNGLRGDQ